MTQERIIFKSRDEQWLVMRMKTETSVMRQEDDGSSWDQGVKGEERWAYRKIMTTFNKEEVFFGHSLSSEWGLFS